MAHGLRLLTRELAALGLDLESTLREGPRFLLDGRLLGALHAELDEHLGALEGPATLRQLGFMHGLLDAARVLREGFSVDALATSAPPQAPGLAVRLGGRPPVEGPGLALAGDWPERHEAAAVLASLGTRATPGCHASAGYTAGWLSGVLDTNLVVVETACAACGAERCEFEAREPEAWRPATAETRAACDALPFAALREAVAHHLETEPAPPAPRSEGFEPGAPVVHVWGPVMVLPFSGPEESLRALELIGRDPGARDVRVVIVDLSGTLVDDGFGAAALEQILDGIESWGAEPILTGVSPLSAGVVAELETSHLVLHKDLSEAIAVGFQIAEAQRHMG